MGAKISNASFKLQQDIIIRHYLYTYSVVIGIVKNVYKASYTT